ncbi:MAG: Ig-like domain-containing protein [Aureliella sp.]
MGSTIIDGSLYVAGYTNNSEFETTSGALYSSKNLGFDGFVRKYSLGTPPPPPVEIEARDSFDNGTPNGGTGPWTGPWNLGSNTGFTSGSTPNDGSTHAIIQRRGSLTRQVDTAGITNLNLSFASKLRSFENSDRAYVKVSPDGSNWTTLKTFVNGEDDNTYRDYSYDIPFEADTLWIRFEGDMSSSRYDYWYVDSVALTGQVASQPPVATDDSSTTDEDQSVTIDVLANDSDPEGDALSIASVTQASSGTATIVGGQVQYTPDPDFNGSDSFTYTINDAAGNAARATVSLSVAPVNDAPVSADDSVTTLEDTPVTFDVLGNDSDVDGDSLSVQSATDGSSGLVSVNSDNTLTYTPNAGFFGTDAFTYTITDGNGGTSTATVNVTVDEQNDPPTAVGDSATTNEDVSLLINVLANDNDPDNDSLSIQSVTQPASGITVIEAGQVRYTPDSNFHGSDSFTYTIVDTAGNTATATVSISITPVNDAPVAADDNYSLDQDTTLTIDAPGVLGNDSDIDGDDLTASLVTGPASGSLTLSADGSFTYTPDAGFVGNDSFVYQAVDNAGAVSESVAVSLQVNAVVTGPNLAHGNVPVVGSSWQTVSLGKSYESAVIVATPRYNNGSGPGVVRISNVTATSFDVRVDNVGTSAFDGGIHFIAMEEGIYDVPGEYKLEAVKVDTSAASRRSGWQISSQAYAQSYNNPVVVGQVMSTNDEWSVFWSSSSSRTSPANSGSLNVGKHVGEDADTTRATETLGYFVIEATSGGTIDGLNFTAGVGSDAIRGVGNGTYQYSGVNPSGATTAVLSGAGMDGNDGGWAVLRGTDPLASNSIQMSIDEDQIGDSERNHTTEQVAYFVIGESAEGEASQLAAPEIRIHDPMDVNGDGFTSPIDALAVVNALNAEPGTGWEEGDMALDTNGNGYLSALDALLVVNHLNASSTNAEAEGADSIQSIVDGYFGDLDDEKDDVSSFFEII